MPIPSRVRYFAKQAYQLALMRGITATTPAEYAINIVFAENKVHVVDLNTRKHYVVTIAKSWANL